MFLVEDTQHFGVYGGKVNNLTELGKIFLSGALERRKYKIATALLQ